MSDLQDALDTPYDERSYKHRILINEAARKWATLVAKQPTCDHVCLFHYRAQTPLELGITACTHSWIEVRNAVVDSGVFCEKCGAMRASGITEDTQ